MPKYYCPSCAAATEYTYNIPKFCSSCGSQTGIVSSAAKAAVTKSEPLKKKVFAKPVYNTHEEDEDDVDFDEVVPSISKLEVEIVAHRPPAETFGAVAQQEKTGFQREKRKYTKKDFQNEFFEQGSARSKPINIGDD